MSTLTYCFSGINFPFSLCTQIHKRANSAKHVHCYALCNIYIGQNRPGREKLAQGFLRYWTVKYSGKTYAQ